MSDGADKFKLGRRKSRRFANSFLERIRSYAGKHKMPEAHIQKIKNYLGLGQLTENLWASDLKLRGKFAEFLGEEIESLRDMSPELNFQFWTLLKFLPNYKYFACLILLITGRVRLCGLNLQNDFNYNEDLQ